MVRGGDKDMKPLLLKLGVTLVLSFAGFFYSRLRMKKISPALAPPCSPGEKEDHKEEISSNPTTPTPFDAVAASISQEKHDGRSLRKIATDDLNAVFASSKKNFENEKEFLLPEFNDLMLNKFEIPSSEADASPRKNIDTPISMRRTVDEDTEQEIVNLRNTVKILQERERNLEFQLLEYYGLKEQESCVMELQNRLKVSNMEAKLLNLKIKSLQADKKRLEAKVVNYEKVLAELESTKMKIKLLKKKIKSDGEQTEVHIATLKQKVTNLQDLELSAIGNDEGIQMNLERLKELEEELAELRAANSRLENENSELARRLDSTQVLAASVLELPEAEAMLEDNNRVRQENNDLRKEIERLRENHSADVEELVYLRWVNACLRYELRNYQAPPGSTVARDLSKTLSPKSEEKAKKLILEYANSEGMGDKGMMSIMDFDSEYWSSQDSNPTESFEYDEYSVDMSSATKSTSSRKLKFFNKLRKLIRGKESHKDNQSSLFDSRTTTSCGASGRVESVSPSLYEEMARPYTGSTISSQNSSRMSSIDLTAIEARADERCSKLNDASQSLRRSSFDIRKIKHQSLEDIKNMEHLRRYSDVGSSYGYKRVSFREGGVSGLEHESRVDQDPGASEKLELMKFAEALEGSNGSLKSHRRAVSYNFF